MTLSSSPAEIPPSEQLILGGRQVSFVRGGIDAAAPVLLLHGGGLDRVTLSLRLLFPHLAKHHHVIAPDWPGHAGSDLLGGPFRIADLGNWLLDLLDALHICCANVP
ncbi:alpha/beta hydrolase family protein [Aliiruegeria haliotis]|uniref:Alpha/beta hydrolase family protein n=1 Tax=Aliiruegeria haliotis TaxID=1280846 RepID=A0A2T0RQ06_9RHOB|nr:alpha/beta fold hydrolase [Aliiruegeria haliotis]PRY23190.1 alpha/beta hydrolase family protein [Aliiruegeria haliotis]